MSKVKSSSDYSIGILALLGAFILFFFIFVDIRGMTSSQYRDLDIGKVVEMLNEDSERIRKNIAKNEVFTIQAEKDFKQQYGMFLVDLADLKKRVNAREGNSPSIEKELAMLNKQKENLMDDFMAFKYPSTRNKNKNWFAL